MSVFCCSIFCIHLVDMARYAALVQTKPPANCDIYLVESVFKHDLGRNKNAGEFLNLYTYKLLLIFIYKRSAKLVGDYTFIEIRCQYGLV